VRLGVS
jgi:hypothetical protein